MAHYSIIVDSVLHHNIYNRTATANFELAEDVKLLFMYYNNIMYRVIRFIPMLQTIDYGNGNSIKLDSTEWIFTSYGRGYMVRRINKIEYRDCAIFIYTEAYYANTTSSKKILSFSARAKQLADCHFVF